MRSGKSAGLVPASDPKGFYGHAPFARKRSLARPVAVASPPRRSPVLADVLRDLGISLETFRSACRSARLHGTTIDEELAALGAATECQLAKAAAFRLGLPFQDVDPDATLVSEALPLSGMEDRVLRTCDAKLAACFLMAPPYELLDELAELLQDRKDEHQHIRITTMSAIRKHRAAASCQERSQRARLSLAADRRIWSARDVLSPWQAAVLTAFAMSLAYGLCHAGTLFWIWLHAAFSSLAFGLTLFRGLSLLSRSPPRRRLAISVQPPAEDRLPIYTVMVALYREAEMAEGLVGAMNALDWPRSRLQILFVCEDGDLETIAALDRAIGSAPHMSVVATPRSNPQTKPKALNFALPLARGEFVVLYDAEDRPHPGQLREAFSRFRDGSPRLACLQAPLVIRNAHRGWLEGLFALEYAVLFRVFLPWLAQHRLPLPLGGTSNHFRRRLLLQAGGWDSHNVAEDADLGIRLARLGHQVGTIHLPTSEIAPSRFIDWRNQRTRWIKGWCQSWLVHMRRPARLFRELGWKGFASFQLVFLGMIASSAMHVVFAGHLLTALWTLSIHGEGYLGLGWLALLDLANIALAYVVFALLAARALHENERPLRRHLWSLWFYWAIVSFAGLRALWQLATRPHHWEKTPHREPGAEPAPVAITAN